MTFVYAPTALPGADGTSTSTLTAKQIQALPGGTTRSLNDVIATQPGIIRDDYGAIHVRGSFAGLALRIDDIPLPPSVQNRLQQLLGSQIVERADVIVGGLPAEFESAAGVVDIQTRRPGPKPDGQLLLAYGTYNAVEGQAFGAGRVGPLSVVAAGSVGTTERGLDPPTASPILHDRLRGGRAFLSADDLLATRSPPAPGRLHREPLPDPHRSVAAGLAGIGGRAEGAGRIAGRGSSARNGQRVRSAASRADRSRGTTTARRRDRARSRWVGAVGDEVGRSVAVLIGCAHRARRGRPPAAAASDRWGSGSGFRCRRPAAGGDRCRPGDCRRSGRRARRAGDRAGFGLAVGGSRPRSVVPTLPAATTDTVRTDRRRRPAPRPHCRFHRRAAAARRASGRGVGSGCRPRRRRSRTRPADPPTMTSARSTIWLPSSCCSRSAPTAAGGCRRCAARGRRSSRGRGWRRSRRG